MPARKPPRPTPPDIDNLRNGLGLGKIVKVGIAPSDQFPDGVTGRVRRIGNPEVDGDEFVFVEVPVGGSKDVLPFALTDLTGAPARTPAGSAPTLKVVPPVVEPVRPRAPLPPSRPAGPPLASVPRAPTGVPTATAAGSPAGNTAGAGTSPTTPTGQKVSPESAPPKPVKPAVTRGKRPPVTITISTAGDESAAWRIEARIGAKVAVRPTVVPPSRVWEIVRSLGEEKLTELVQTLLDDHRKSTQARADALAAELSALQAELSSFPTRSD